MVRAARWSAVVAEAEAMMFRAKPVAEVGRRRAAGGVLERCRAICDRRENMGESWASRL